METGLIGLIFQAILHFFASLYFSQENILFNYCQDMDAVHSGLIVCAGSTAWKLPEPVSQLVSACCNYSQRFLSWIFGSLPLSPVGECLL